jgi:hypothetical protein
MFMRTATAAQLLGNRKDAAGARRLAPQWMVHLLLRQSERVLRLGLPLPSTESPTSSQ